MTPTVSESFGVPPTRRPPSKRVLHLVRRGHLVVGLLLFPWAILYGVTAFLFNHPTAFSDQPATHFGREAIVGTPLETLPSLEDQTAAVIAELNRRAGDSQTYCLADAGSVRYAREFAFATVKAEGQQLSVLYDVAGQSGTIRSKLDEPAPTTKAPFALGTKAKTIAETASRVPRTGHDKLQVEQPIHERFKSALPTILARAGFPTGEITITSVPDLAFTMSDTTQTWNVIANAQTGTVNGKLVGEAKDELSVRRFLLRLHLTHGYPGSFNAKWAWAIIVDAMAFTMIFWGLSGLLMWWQIKATRRLGMILLIVSGVGAFVLAFAMHNLLTA